MYRAIERPRSRAWPHLPRLARSLWDLIWLPFWLGSTLPPPALPTRREVDMVRADRRPAILGQLDALRAAIWRQRAGILGFRSLWLALAVVDVGLALRVVAHRSVSLVPFLLVALATLALGAALVASARPSRGPLARTLDRSFGLRERVSTALEQTRAGRLTGLRALQVVDATRLTGTLGEARAFQRRLPVRELLLTALMGVIFVRL